MHSSTKAPNDGCCRSNLGLNAYVANTESTEKRARSFNPSESGPGDVLCGEVQVEPPSGLSEVLVLVGMTRAASSATGKVFTDWRSSYYRVTRREENSIGDIFSEKTHDQPFGETIGARADNLGADLGILEEEV